MQPRISNLVAAIREAMPSMPRRTVGRATKMPWPRPPLRTDQTLRGLRLDYFAAPRCNLSLSEFRMAFEEYVELTLVHPDPGFDPVKFFQKSLKVQPRMAQWLFPVVASLYDHLATFLWVAHVSLPETKFEEMENTCVVRAGDIAFGVRDNVLVSRFHAIPVKPFDYKSSIDQHSQRGDQLSCTANLLIGVYVHAATVKDPDERRSVELALQYLFYRYGNMGRLADYFYRTQQSTNRTRGKGLKGTLLHLVRNLYVDDNPMPSIFYQLVVRKIVERAEFRTMFDEDLLALVEQPKDTFVEYPDLLRISKILKRKKT